MVCFAGSPYPLYCRRLFHKSRHALPLQAPAVLPILPSDNPLPFNDLDPSPHHIISPPQLSQNQPQLSPASSCISPLNLENYELLVHHYRNSRSLKDAHQLHLQIYKTGFANDVFLSNTLINIYVRIGKLVSAQKLFNEVPQKNNVSWACLISGFTQNGIPDEACRLFKGMICANLFPNHYAIGSVLRACQKCGPSKLLLGMQIHGIISKTRYASDMFLSNVLMSMYANCLGSIDDARRVFDEIQIKNSIAWNSIISVYCYRGNAASSFELFSSMQREAITLRPNEYTFGSLVTATHSLVDHGLSLLEQILARIEKSGFLQDLYAGSALVSGSASLG